MFRIMLVNWKNSILKVGCSSTGMIIMQEQMYCTNAYGGNNSTSAEWKAWRSSLLTSECCSPASCKLREKERKTLKLY